MARKYNYYGFIENATRHRHSADILFETIKPLQAPAAFHHKYPDGSQISVTKIADDIEVADIWGVRTGKKRKRKWVLLYTPAPRPDPQDWPGWIEADRDTLVATNFLDDFSLLGFGMPFYGDFNTVVPEPVPVPITSRVVQGGWWASSVSYFDTGHGWYLGLDWRAIGVEHSGIRHQTILNYTFPYNLFHPKTIVNWSESGTKKWIGGKFINYVPNFLNPVPPETDSDTSPPLALPTYTPGAVGSYHAHGEGLISWESLYMLGFWKVEWTFWTPSTILDLDNYCGFYDYYSWDSAYGSNLLNPFWSTIIDDSFNISGFTSAQNEVYLANCGGTADHVVFPHASDEYRRLYIYDPDGDPGGYSVASITYETHFAGKYEGVYFDDIVGTASWSGTEGWVGSWGGDNVFPWMARMYHKDDLLEGEEGEELPSKHHLIIASWFVGPAEGPSGAHKVPYCYSGIQQTVYRMIHGNKKVTKAYAASHPGWHNVITINGRTFRAYGDMFAALKGVEEEEEG